MDALPEKAPETLHAPFALMDASVLMRMYEAYEKYNSSENPDGAGRGANPLTLLNPLMKHNGCTLVIPRFVLQEVLSDGTYTNTEKTKLSLKEYGPKYSSLLTPNHAAEIRIGKKSEVYRDRRAFCEMLNEMSGAVFSDGLPKLRYYASPEEFLEYHDSEGVGGIAIVDTEDGINNVPLNMDGVYTRTLDKTKEKDQRGDRQIIEFVKTMNDYCGDNISYPIISDDHNLFNNELQPHMREGHLHSRPFPTNALALISAYAGMGQFGVPATPFNPTENNLYKLFRNGRINRSKTPDRPTEFRSEAIGRLQEWLSAIETPRNTISHPHHKQEKAVAEHIR